jgi:hypothetical protein
MMRANPLMRILRTLAAAGHSLLARYRWMDAQIWQIAKTDGPDGPKQPNTPPKIRCC